MFYHNDDPKLTQPGRRRSFNITDQWGRKWLCSIELLTGAVTGLISPCFTDPLATPQKYLRIDPMNPLRMDIAYAEWLRDLEEAHRIYRGRVIEVSRALYGARAEVDRPATEEVIYIVGLPPTDMAQVRLAAAGHQSVLGVPPVMDDTREKPAQPVEASPAIVADLLATVQAMREEMANLREQIQQAPAAKPRRATPLRGARKET